MLKRLKKFEITVITAIDETIHDTYVVWADSIDAAQRAYEVDQEGEEALPDEVLPTVTHVGTKSNVVHIEILEEKVEEALPYPPEEVVLIFDELEKTTG